ncbi:Peptidyl-prolyl cis-trans isomerase CYP40 [Hordeum vulgare]|nr:Peptidyl-prolyl cis-trans isomerase CYP40 [Hordeum vulgare]
MAQCACRARQRAWEAAKALAAVDVGDMGSHSLAPRIMHGCGHHNCAVVNIVSSQEGSVIDLTSTSTVRVMGSDEEEYDMGDGGSSTPVIRLVSRVLLYLVSDKIDTTKGAADRRTWARGSWTSSACIRFTLHVIIWI